MTGASAKDGPVALRMTLDGTPEAVTQALRNIRATVETAQPVPAPDSGWELLLAEVLNNVVEHAYADAETGEIHLSLRFGSDALTADVIDYGAPMPDETAPPGNPASLDVPLADLPEGGFGWFLIRTMTSRLEYRREGRENHLSFEMPLRDSA